MEKLINTFKITLKELNGLTSFDKKFLSSLDSQLNNGKTLSEKQTNTLNTILNRSLNIEIPVSKLVDLYTQNFYRTDYHGDYLNDYRTVCLFENPNTTIQNMNAYQYGVESYEPEFVFNKRVEVPSTLKTETEINKFLEFKHQYDLLIGKLKRNSFRTIKTKNRGIQAIKSILSGEYDKNLIDLATGQNFKHWKY